MKTGRPRPIDRESEFALNELFFSTTDLIGNITSGNTVFVRVSQYDKEELIGAPHNIIRHPEMPRLVFKVLWDYLKAQKPVVAYVKNMTKEGRYYWVLACAFPISGGYLSIRTKPCTDIFKLIPGVYDKLLTAEENGGMEASLQLLLEVLKSKGFDDYESFMSTVLIEELDLRQKLINDQTSIEQVKGELKAEIKDRIQWEQMKTLNRINDLCSATIGGFERLFSDFSNLLTIEETLRSRSKSVLNFSEQISILSLNVNIKSYFAQEAGRTISVVAKTIKLKTEEIESHTQSIVNRSKDISVHTKRLGFHTSTPRLQAAMINAFIQELLAHVRVKKIEAVEMEEIKSNILILIELFMNTFSHLKELLVPIGGKINEILTLINSINSAINELQRCNFLGNIEAAVIGEKGVNFIYTFNEVKESSETTQRSLQEFKRYLNSVNETTKSISVMHAQIFSYVESIKTTVDHLKTQDTEPVLKARSMIEAGEN